MHILITGISAVNDIPDMCYDLPNTGTNESELLHAFIEAINNDKPYAPTIQIIRLVHRILVCSSTEGN